jgi:hypothetical protein
MRSREPPDAVWRPGVLAKEKGRVKKEETASELTNPADLMKQKPKYSMYAYAY